MKKPTFLGPLVGKRAGRFELIHVESGAVLASRVEPALDSKARRRGLRGRDSVPGDFALISAPCRVLPTSFMRFSIDAVFVSRDGTVVKTCRALRPWRIAGSVGAFAVIESASGFIDRSGTIPGDRIAIREVQLAGAARDVRPLRRDPASGSDRGPDVDPWDLGEMPQRQAGSARSADPGRGLRGRAPDAKREGAAESIDLARFLARGVPIAWFEAVAVVQELYAEVEERGPEQDLRVPELHEIAITSAGGVELLGRGPAAPSPVAPAARVLLTLLGEAKTLPVQLRLLALEDVSPTPRHGSLQELSKALEFFERPGRRAIVRELYDRFRQAPAVEAEEAVNPSLRPVTPAPSLAWWERRSVQAVVGIAALAVLVGSLVWLWPGPEGPRAAERRGPVERAVSTSVEKVVQVAEASVNAVAQWLGLRAPDRPAASAPPEPTPAAVGVSVPRASGSRPGAARPAAKPGPGATDAASDAEPASADATIYSAVDRAVVPPVQDRSRLPSNPRPDVSQDQLAQVEIVVSATGEVESVRLVTEPVRVQALMMLSVVKTWRFQPATRDGLPVRYRMRMRLTNQ